MLHDGYALTLNTYEYLPQILPQIIVWIAGYCPMEFETLISLVSYAIRKI